MTSLKSENNEMSIQSKKRLLKDVKDIYKTPLHDQGIYYIHDETNMKKGYAVVFGPSDTLYQYGAYFFELKYPNNYPFAPPKVIYMTNDGKTRFNPNLYKNGKVCLSLIGTWAGPGWTPCNTISSVLLSIKSMILVKDAIKNEPGFEKTTSLIIDSYEDTIKHENFRVAILYILQKMPEPFETYFRKDIEKYFVNNFDSYMKQIEEYKTSNIDKKVFVFKIYNLYINNNYEQIQTELNKIYNNIINK